MKKRYQKGFTLAELLIVVAIIAVLVAISIPIFTSQLEKSRRAVDLSNARNMKSILMNSYAGGTIQFPKKTENVVGAGTVNTYVAAIVKRDDTYYRASGSVLVDGGNWEADHGNGDYARVRKLFENTGFSATKVHAKSTKNEGWASYGVVLFSDGSCRIFSSESDIDLGDSSGGVFEKKLENILSTNQTGIEKAMGN